MTIRAPSPRLVEKVASEEAERAGVTMMDVLGITRRRPACSARKRAWVRLVTVEKYPICGVAMIWGCDRRGIQRALRGPWAITLGAS